MTSSHPEPRRMLWLRHGRTAWNLESRAQGHAELSLDEVGHRQAAEAAPLIAAYRPARIVSSDLARAAETAAYVGEACGLPVTLDPRLREFHVGDNRMGLTTAEYAERFPEEHAHWLAGRISEVPGRETTAQVLARFLPAVEELADSLAPGECGVLVGHGAALRVGIVAFLDWPEEVVKSFGGPDNGGWVEFVEAHSSFYGGPPRWRLLRYNVSPGTGARTEAPNPDFSDVGAGR